MPKNTQLIIASYKTDGENIYSGISFKNNKGDIIKGKDCIKDYDKFLDRINEKGPYKLFKSPILGMKRKSFNIVINLDIDEYAISYN